MIVRLMWLAQWIAAHLPLVVGNFMADRAGDIAYYLARYSRCAAESNMRHVLPSGTSQKIVMARVHGVFRNLARNYYDLLRCYSMSDTQIDSMIEFDKQSWQLVREFLEHTGGVLLVSAHFGAFDIVSHVLARRGMPVTLIIDQTKPFALSDFLTRLRTKRGISLANLQDGISALRRAREALRKGESVAVFADRNPAKTGLMIPFFGEETNVASGMAKLALRSQVPVVVSFCYRRERSYVVHFEPPIFPPSSGDDEQELTQFTRIVFGLYEKHIGKCPEQWVLLKPVWSDAPC